MQKIDWIQVVVVELISQTRFVFVVVDGILKLLSRLEQVVGGGGVDRNELYVAREGERYLCNQRLRKSLIEMIIEVEVGDL